MEEAGHGWSCSQSRATLTLNKGWAAEDRIGSDEAMPLDRPLNILACSVVFSTIRSRVSPLGVVPTPPKRRTPASLAEVPADPPRPPRSLPSSVALPNCKRSGGLSGSWQPSDG